MTDSPSDYNTYRSLEAWLVVIPVTAVHVSMICIRRPSSEHRYELLIALGTLRDQCTPPLRGGSNEGLLINRTTTVKGGPSPLSL